MAINTKSLTDLITEFRVLQSKDAISPESLGYILQRIVDVLSTAGTSETIDSITRLLDGFKSAGQALTALSQGQSDRNHIYADKSTVNLATGAVSSTSGIFIQQATTERAGAMRAQQVIDLNAAKKGVSELEKQMATVNDLISELQEAINGGEGFVSISSLVPISVSAEDGILRVRGYAKLAEKGFVPYIFRLTKKRNQFKDKDRKGQKKYCSKRKGWNLWGSMYAVKVENEVVYFSINNKSELVKTALGWSTAPTALIKVHTNKKGYKTIGWGRSIINIHDSVNGFIPRMLRLRFAIGFGKAVYPGRARVTPATLSSTLAEFSIVYFPKKDAWVFSK